MNDRFKFRVWDKHLQGYVKENLGEKYVWIEDDGQLGAGIDDDSCILEQCTGLKDKNGNLIYEGDIIKDWRWDSFKVVWLNDIAQFFGVNINDDTDGYNLDDNIEFFEIVGNVHEQPEQKDK